MRSVSYLVVSVLAVITGCAHDPTCPLDQCGSACVDTASDVAHCGGCGLACSPAADCAESACSCPSNFMPAAPMFAQVMMRDNIAQLPGLMTGIGLIAHDTKLDGLLVAFDPATIPVGVDIDLATVVPTTLRVGFGYEIEALTTIRGAFLATGGTLHLSSACATGVAGVLSNVSTIEIDLFDNFAAIAGGCTLAVPSVTFAIGTCPVSRAGDRSASDE